MANRGVSVGGVSWAVAVMVLSLPQQLAANQCSINNGQCTYHVHLNHGCHSNSINQIQNDYDEKVNQIEKSLTDVRKEHDKKIIELENKMSQLLGGKRESGAVPGLDPSSWGKQPYDKGSQVGLFDKDKERQENGLLNMLHKEFSALRKELAETKRKLREAEKYLLATRHKLNKTNDELIKTTRKLLDTEKALDISKEKHEKCSEDLADKIVELNSANIKLDESQQKLKKTQLEFASCSGEMAKKKKETSVYKLLLEQSRRLLQQALKRYHKLNVKHATTRRHLKNKRQDLVRCYRGKTSQFCGFEDVQMCGFKQMTNVTSDADMLDWTRWHGSTPSAHTGPDVDHTCRNDRGYYMYLEATAKGKKNNAKIISPRYQGLEEQCVEFYYHMFGRHVGTLNVYTKVPRNDVVPMWRAYGNQGDVWSLARIQIPDDVSEKGYQVVFEGILEQGFQGDIAIDDFRIFDGKCFERKNQKKNARPTS